MASAKDTSPARVLRLAPSGEVVGQRLDDVLVVVHLETNRIHELNRTGARFWELLQDEPDVEQVERQMLAEFDVSEADLRAELDKLIGELVAERLVTVLARS
ncbi:MAG: PqqD family protein [Solirubrobacteraceae bacterium]